MLVSKAFIQLARPPLGRRELHVSLVSVRHLADSARFPPHTPGCPHHETLIAAGCPVIAWRNRGANAAPVAIGEPDRVPLWLGARVRIITEPKWPGSIGTNLRQPRKKKHNPHTCVIWVERAARQRNSCPVPRTIPTLTPLRIRVCVLASQLLRLADRA